MKIAASHIASQSFVNGKRQPTQAVHPKTAIRTLLTYVQHFVERRNDT